MIVVQRMRGSHCVDGWRNPQYNVEQRAIRNRTDHECEG